MMKRRWALLGFNLMLATAILVQPGGATWSTCDFNECACACLEEWDECFESKEEDCHRKFNKCLRKAKCTPEIDIG